MSLTKEQARRRAAGREVETSGDGPAVCLRNCLFLPDFHSEVKLETKLRTRTAILIRFRVVGHVRTRTDFQLRGRARSDIRPNCLSVRQLSVLSLSLSLSRPRIIEGATSPSAGCKSPLHGRKEGRKEGRTLETSIETALAPGCKILSEFRSKYQTLGNYF